MEVLSRCNPPWLRTEELDSKATPLADPLQQEHPACPVRFKWRLSPMAVEQQAILNALQGVLDPNTGKDFVSTKALKNLQIAGSDVSSHK